MKDVENMTDEEIAKTMENYFEQFKSEEFRDLPEHEQKELVSEFVDFVCDCENKEGDSGAEFRFFVAATSMNGDKATTLSQLVEMFGKDRVVESLLMTFNDLSFGSNVEVVKGTYDEVKEKLDNLGIDPEKLVSEHADHSNNFNISDEEKAFLIEHRDTIEDVIEKITNGSHDLTEEEKEIMMKFLKINEAKGQHIMERFGIINSGQAISALSSSFSIASSALAEDKNIKCNRLSMIGGAFISLLSNLLIDTKEDTNEVTNLYSNHGIEKVFEYITIIENMFKNDISDSLAEKNLDPDFVILALLQLAIKLYNETGFGYSEYIDSDVDKKSMISLMQNLTMCFLSSNYAPEPVKDKVIPPIIEAICEDLDNFDVPSPDDHENEEQEDDSDHEEQEDESETKQEEQEEKKSPEPVKEKPKKKQSLRDLLIDN